uniref:Uncharacterized protein n=1 Tax=Arundo donax TaxID=35708 RepID=A0A0A8ZY54_ARUDO
MMFIAPVSSSITTSSLYRTTGGRSFGQAWMHWNLLLFLLIDLSHRAHDQ